jgi:hypothetical protein
MACPTCSVQGRYDPRGAHTRGDGSRLPGCAAALVSLQPFATARPLLRLFHPTFPPTGLLSPSDRNNSSPCLTLVSTPLPLWYQISGYSGQPYTTVQHLIWDGRSASSFGKRRVRHLGRKCKANQTAFVTGLYATPARRSAAVTVSYRCRTGRNGRLSRRCTPRYLAVPLSYAQLARSVTTLYAPSTDVVSHPTAFVPSPVAYPTNTGRLPAQVPRTIHRYSFPLSRWQTNTGSPFPATRGCMPHVA